jgi:hypothetical protein
MTSKAIDFSRDVDYFIPEPILQLPVANQRSRSTKVTFKSACCITGFLITLLQITIKVTAEKLQNVKYMCLT